MNATRTHTHAMPTHRQFETISHALDWINTISSKKPLSVPKPEKLKKITHVLQLLNNPQNTFKSIHITGSKGKSSTALACAYFLKEMGHKVGLFTSPHIHHYNERIRINLTPIEDSLLLSTCNRIYNVLDANKITLTMFELFTVIACMIFKDAEISHAIFEVGIGGRYDTTNFLIPELCIISNIEKEHCEILGSTIEEIALDKAGIIKPHTPVWVAEQSYASALSIIKQYAKSQSAPVFYAPEIYRLNITDIEQTIKNNFTQKIPMSTHTTQKFLPNNALMQNCKVQRSTEYHLTHISHIESPVIMPVLLKNHVLADIAMHHYVGQQFPQKRIYRKEINMPCRSEICQLSERQYLYMDGAHTALSLTHSLEVITTLPSTLIVVFALSAKKDYEEISNLLHRYAPRIKKMIVTIPSESRKGEPIEVYKAIRKNFEDAYYIENNASAILKAHTFTQDIADADKNAIPILCVLGSFYLCATFRKWYMVNVAT